MTQYSKGEITKGELVFIETYFNNGFNAAQAYMTAFPEATYKSAKYSGYRLMAKPVIKEEIERIWAEVKDLQIVKREEIMIALKELMDQSIENGNSNDLLKTIDTINKMTGAYTLQIDANIKNNIILTIPGLEPDKEEDKEIEE